MKVNIVGAGISGLYAGNLLSKSNIAFDIFEATERSGGRIYSRSYDKSQFVELGAEVVYAPESLLIKTLETIKDPIFSMCGYNLYVYKQYLLSRQNFSDHLAIKKLIEDLYDLEDYVGEEMSIIEYFQQQKYYQSDMINLVEAFACEYGTTADKLGIKNLAYEESLWSGGDDEFYSKLPLQRVSDYYRDKISENIQYNTPIKSISYSSDGVSIIDDRGRTYQSDKTIVSVSLGILKAGDITFDPVLPYEKLQAIKAIGIEGGMKVILIFSKQWWPNDILTIEGGDLCCEFLATKNYDLPTLTGFVMGRKVLAFQNMKDNQVGEMLTKELDKIFRHSKASDTLSHVFIKNWGEDVYHKGAYSFPTRESSGMREKLAQPIGDKLFFLGEACSINGHAASVHGAMETAETVCRKLKQCIG